MEPNLQRAYKFNELFTPMFGVKLAERPSPDAPLEISDVNLKTIGAVLNSVQLFCHFIGLIKCFKADPFDLGETCEIGAKFAVYVICLSRGIVLLVKQRSIKKLLLNLESIYPVSWEDQVSHGLPAYAERMILFEKFMTKLATFGIITYNTLPGLQSFINWYLYNQEYVIKYQNKSWYPVDTESFYFYPIVYFFEMFVTLFYALSIVNDDMLYSFAVNQMCMHYRYLGDVFSHLDAQDKDLKQWTSIRKLIEYQTVLNTLSDDVSDVFSAINFLGFTLMKVSMCMFVFVIYSETDFFTILPFIAAILVQLVPAYFKCSNSTDLYSASEDLPNCIYAHNWYEGNPMYRKVVSILILRANKPVILKSWKIKQISKEYFKELMMESYQVFMIIHNSYSGAN